jgi:hypothetical protein
VVGIARLWVPSPVVIMYGGRIRSSWPKTERPEVGPPKPTAAKVAVVEGSRSTFRVRVLPEIGSVAQEQPAG